ncbi:hypothetical protein HDV00_011297 [Rhizophlyctis rosea]|nr:hypothetical protein HDV00_011297 [Rhizophlyctis rosea]
METAISQPTGNPSHTISHHDSKSISSPESTISPSYLASLVIFPISYVIAVPRRVTRCIGNLKRATVAGAKSGNGAARTASTESDIGCSDIDSLTTELAAKTSQVERTNLQNETLRVENLALKKMVERMGTIIEKLHVVQLERGGEIAELKKRGAEARADAHWWKDKQAMVSAELRDERRKLGVARDELQHQATHLAEAHAQIRTLKTVESSLTAQVHQIELSYAGLERTVHTMEATLDQEVEQLEKERTEIVHVPNDAVPHFVGGKDRSYLTSIQNETGATMIVPNGFQHTRTVHLSGFRTSVSLAREIVASSMFLPSRVIVRFHKSNDDKIIGPTGNRISQRIAVQRKVEVITTDPDGNNDRLLIVTGRPDKVHWALHDFYEQLPKDKFTPVSAAEAKRLGWLQDRS